MVMFFNFSMSKAGLACAPCRAMRALRGRGGDGLAHEHDVLNSRQFGVVRVCTAHLRLAEFSCPRFGFFSGRCSRNMRGLRLRRCSGFEGVVIVQALTNA